MELERILKFSVEDGKSLTDDEVIEVYKLIEANIEHVRFSHNEFFIYLSDRYLGKVRISRSFLPKLTR